MNRRQLNGSRSMMKMALAAGLFAAAPAFGQDGTSALQYEVFGVNRGTAELVKYNLATAAFETVGVVRDAQGNALTGIEAGAYAPGYANIFGFWFDSGANASRVVFIDILDAKGTIVGREIEGGMVTGAAAAQDGNGKWHVFAVQHEQQTPPVAIEGSVNLNPNNNDDMEFGLRVGGDGDWDHTRDNLLAASGLDADGTYYRGVANRVRVRPKGNGNQNGIMLNGEPMNLRNSNTYTFTGDMTVRVYNDKVSGAGKAMGKWWIEISGSAILEDDSAVVYPNRLVHVDHMTGDVTERVRLSREYDSLATSDGQTFFASAADGIYAIDVTAETETLVKSASGGSMTGMAFAGSNLMGTRATSASLNQLNLDSSGSLVISSTSIGAANLGTIVFTPAGVPDPNVLLGAFD